MDIRNLPVEEIISILNDNLDTIYFPVGQIAEIDDDEQWDKVGEYLDGSTFVKLMRKGIPEGAKWFAVDTESNQIYWFKSKQAIIDAFGISTIQYYYDCMND